MSALTIRLLGPGDAAVLDDLAPDVLDGPVLDRWLTAVLASTHQHLAVALDGTRVVAMASAVHIAQPDKAPKLYVDEIGTARAYRRRGIARALMAALTEHARALGCTQVWLLTEAENTPARAFYTALAMRETDRPVLFTAELASLPPDAPRP